MSKILCQVASLVIWFTVEREKIVKSGCIYISTGR